MQCERESSPELTMGGNNQSGEVIGDGWVVWRGIDGIYRCIILINEGWSRSGEGTYQPWWEEVDKSYTRLMQASQGSLYGSA